MAIFNKLSVICFVLLTVHLMLNFLVVEPISFLSLLGFQMFYALSLFLSVLYMKKGIKKDSSRIWINYMSIVSIKFFVFLGFVFGMKSYFEISKIQALTHVFSWFFIYLFIEVKLILSEIKTIENGNR